VDDRNEEEIRSIVRNQVKGFSTGFCDRHLAEVNNPDGTINSKVHNIFIAALGKEIQFYSSLVRSLDSSLGSLIESMALSIAETHFEVQQQVTGDLYVEQTRAIADLLQSYLTRRQAPSAADYQELRTLTTGVVHPKTHASDYILRNRATGELHLIELKLGGDLDNKKARSEKEALLEQFCILSNSSPASQTIRVHFATAYNRYGEGKAWKQERVRQFFGEDELLISSGFWNFLAQDDDGFRIVMDEYSQQAHLINAALDTLKETYVHR
jgi:hypothetical protein